jgi:predicted ester cyclase
METWTTDLATQKEIARRALERVCTGDELDSADQCYHPRFRDHVNAADFEGFEGIHQSVSLYSHLFPDLAVTVADQIAEGDRVASRWTMRGTNDGREISWSGITISRFEDGRIREDWSYFDSGDLARQLEAG